MVIQRSKKSRQLKQGPNYVKQVQGKCFNLDQSHIWMEKPRFPIYYILIGQEQKQEFKVVTDNVVSFNLLFKFTLQQIKQSYIQRESKIMSNFENVCLASENKVRRASKISYALKTRFLALLKKQGTSIKYMANQLGINYSTAKVIVKQNKANCKSKTKLVDQEYFPVKQKREKKIKKEKIQCSYRPLTGGQLICARRSGHIEIISTISLNFVCEKYSRMIHKNNLLLCPSTQSQNQNNT